MIPSDGGNSIIVYPTATTADLEWPTTATNWGTGTTAVSYTWENHVSNNPEYALLALKHRTLIEDRGRMDRAHLDVKRERNAALEERDVALEGINQLRKEVEYLRGELERVRAAIPYTAVLLVAAVGLVADFEARLHDAFREFKGQVHILVEGNQAIVTLTLPRGYGQHTPTNLIRHVESNILPRIAGPAEIEVEFDVG